MTALLMCVYLLLFQAAAIPAIVRVRRLRSSKDLSVWREWLVLIGVAAQFTVMWRTGASWFVLASPIVSACSLTTLLTFIYRYR